MSGFTIIDEAVTAERGYGTQAAAQSWDQGDPLCWVAGLLDTTTHADTTVLIEADAVAGFALEPATGIRAPSRPADSATANLVAGMNGPPQRSFVNVTGSGVRLNTVNFWATGAPGTPVVPVAADIGVAYNLSAVAAVPPVNGIWGVEQTAATIATDVCAYIEDILNADGLPTADFGGTATSINFVVRL